MGPLGWMFVGYSVMWAAIVAYVANLGRRQAAAERELAALRAALDAESAAELATGGAPEALAPAAPEHGRPATPAR